MSIFETDGKVKHYAVLAVFVSLLVGGCSLFDRDNDNDKDRSKGEEKLTACEKAKKEFDACVAAKGSVSDCVELRELVAEHCGG